MSDWVAQFVAANDAFDGAPLLRKEVDLDQGHGPVSLATLRLSALGVIEAFINGVPVSDDVLTPGWTSFEWRLRYAEYDVTAHLALLTRGRFVLGAALGNGWFRTRLGWDEAPPYGPELAALMEVRIRFQDGHEQVVGTDPSWSAAASAVTANGLYDGQHIDARRVQAGWIHTGFDDSSWGGTHVADFDMARLTEYVSPRVRRQQTITPTRIWESPSGKVLIDFGQNLVGWVRVAVHGDAGDVVTLRHAEVLEHGELGTRPRRTAKATDVYTLSGGDDRFEPTLTFHGFRYVEVDGWPGGLDNLRSNALTAIVVSSDLRRIGHFESSDPLLNQLHVNIVWSMRGNFLDVPTDCPQRDERLGWTGDIAAFAPTAAFLYDVGGFLRDWLRDLAVEQEHQDRIVPFVVPDILKYNDPPEEFSPVDSTAVWSDAAAWVPWAAWQAYGDHGALDEALASMIAHARRVRSLLSERGVWENGFQFGDWLDPDAPPERPAAAKADRSVVATASAYRTARIVAEAAALTGHHAEAVEFEGMAEDLKRAFRAAYVHDERINSDCTTVYALAIAFGLLSEAEKVWAGRRLAELAAASGYRISTGFAGTPFILDALTSTGHIDVAYRLLLQRECPSWLYPVTMGATTVWERWDAMLPDGSINPGAMTSFNHYALGAVADWLHRVIGGLAPLEPGYRRLLIAPQPGPGVDWARTSLETPHGRASVQWQRRGERIAVSVVVPDDVTAIFQAPNGEQRTLLGGTHELSFSTMAASELKAG